MKRVFILMLFTFLVVGMCFAQAPDFKTIGVLRVSIPSFHYEIVAPKENEEVYEVFVQNGKFSKRIPFIGRSIQKDQDGNSLYHVDKYEIRIKKGLYRLFIKNVESYKLPIFLIKPGEPIHFHIPQFRFAWDMICQEKQQILRTFHDERPLSDQLKQYSKPPYSKIRTDVLILEKPFEMVVRYCGRERKGTATYYKSAQVYYKNYYISAETLILQTDSLRLTATGTDESPILVEINGKEIEEKAKFSVDLNLESKPSGQ